MNATTKKSDPAVLKVRAKKGDDTKISTEETISRYVVTVAAAQSCLAMEPWVKNSIGAPDISALRDTIEAQTKAMHGGDMSEIEAMLFAQALTLQATFTALSRKAAANAGEYMGATDTYLRLALKAQGQCRATLETLANIKNPRPVAFVKQANIAQNQQVNNHAGEFSDATARTREKTVNQPNELLTDARGTHGNPLDTGTTRKAGASNPRMATVAKRHRATNE
jgi:hypothetical protein